MTISEFIKQNRNLIDVYIKKNCSNCIIDSDSERELWIMNDEYLYKLAIMQGVGIGDEGY